MIANVLTSLFEIIIGFASGIAVGCGFIAFLMVLGIIPRLIQLTKTQQHMKLFTVCIIAGSVFGTYLSFTTIPWKLPIIMLCIWGGIHGIFNGMLAAALTEVLNAFPIISRRIGMEQRLLWLLMAFVFGKIFGSLFQWLVLVR